MRRALQDQLSALDALSDISSRHAFSSAVSAPEQRSEPGRRERDQAPAPVPHDAAYPAQRGGYDYGQPPSEQMGWPQNEPSQGRPAPSDVPLPLRAYQAEPQQAPALPVPFPEAQPGERRNQWSLGDLLARASEDDAHYPEKDESYGFPPSAPSFAPRGGGSGFSHPDAAGPDFEMSDIASCIDERRVIEIWGRLKRGESEVLQQRGLYSRQAQVIVDRVQHRYETDQNFRGVVERYLSDFEKMLQDVSRSDSRGTAIQARLGSDDGRIYFVLAHLSGRLNA
jgi:hypothetical protein